MFTRIAPRSEGGVPADLGTPELPGSKSHTQRAQLLAALLPGPRVTVRGGLVSRDTRVLDRALATLTSASATDVPVVHLDENGTGLRTLAVVSALLGRRVRFDGAPGLRRRPLDALFAVLRDAGVAVHGDGLPFTTDPSRAQWGEAVHVDGRVTTQVASGVVLGAGLAAANGRPGPHTILVTDARAGGYLDVTVEMLRAFGARLDVDDDGGGEGTRVFQLAAEPWGERPRTVTVPVDASTAIFPAVLARLHGLAWQPPARAASDRHPDWAALDLVADLGAVGAAGFETFALGSCPDAFPALCALAAGAGPGAGPRVLRGAPALRAKESDRIAAMVGALRQLGCDVEEHDDGLTITRGIVREPDAEPELVVPADHRVVMACALLGTMRPLAVTNGGAVDKSWPEFWSWLRRIAVVQGDV